MKTFTVPIFLGVRAEDKAEAFNKVCVLFEQEQFDFDPATFPYCDVGLEPEIIEQLEEN